MSDEEKVIESIKENIIFLKELRAYYHGVSDFYNALDPSNRDKYRDSFPFRERIEEIDQVMISMWSYKQMREEKKAEIATNKRKRDNELL